MKTLKVLGIETSCDETAASIIEANENGDGMRILGNTVHSQIDVHKEFGGVFPMLAKREHEINLPIVLEKTMKEADATPEDIDLIAVTIGPGLEPAIWTGILFVQELAKKWNKKIVPCNHMEGHVLTALIEKDAQSESSYKFISPPFPALSLLISGGHTQIVLVEGIGKYRIVGETLDDAIGECFDKIARMLGLQYPGGPKISKLAEEARREGITGPEPLPRPMIYSKNLNFSFSGLKTAVLYLIKKLGKLDEKTIKGICREAEYAVTEVVIAKMRAAVEQFAAQSIAVGGGVIANKNIREHMKKLAEDCSIPLFLPQFDHATDNGLMIALAGYMNREKAVDADTSLRANGTLPIGPRA